jgi:hypothetical protein
MNSARETFSASPALALPEAYRQGHHAMPVGTNSRFSECLFATDHSEKGV